MINYEKLMKKCFSLAKKAEGQTAPNPMVGAILVDDDGNIISTGYHHKCGQAHAERNAINNAKSNAKNKTLIVNLEPCSHYGKTPPCADLIIESGIKKVVIATLDTNPQVAGKGIEKLKNAGIEVVYPILEDEAKKLNEIFFKNKEKNKIFVASKIAQTLDGKIALQNGTSKWITSDKSRKLVQKIRHKYDAILTSATTVIADNPSLTIRTGTKKLTRIILDKNLSCPIQSKVFNNDGAKIFVFTSKTDYTNYPDNINFIKTPLKNDHIDLTFVCDYLFKNGITSVLIEAGGGLNNAFLQENLIDKLYLFIAPKIFADKNAINSFWGNSLTNIENSKKFEITNQKNLSPDILLELTCLN